jgi:hypothetical protein
MRYIWLGVRGFLIWLVPFGVSFFFYNQERELTSSYALFKSVMFLVLVWTTLAVGLIRPPRATPAWLVGLIYLAINLGLDALVVLPLTGLSLPTYFEQIGIGYLLIPTVTYVLLRQGGRRAGGLAAAG